MEPIAAPRRLHEHVVESLVRGIVSGELRPGSALPTEPEMSARFGVSRSVVREALRVLDARGLIEVRHGSGTRVSAVVLRDLLEARKIVECEVAALAASRAEAADLAALDAALAIMRGALDDPARYVEGDSAFHLALLHAARNRVLERMTQPMHELLSFSQAITDAIPGVLTTALRDHEAIAEAVRRRDPSAARDAMHEHLARTERHIISMTEASP
ncbi:MAG TPA: FadR/GntR family transcriptional regulator [Candidatus Elarobacter sp.]